MGKGVKKELRKQLAEAEAYISDLHEDIQDLRSIIAAYEAEGIRGTPIEDTDFGDDGYDP